MNVKEIILAGGKVSFPYKTKKGDWIGQADIFIYNGDYHIKPKIVVRIEGHQEFDFAKIDESIEFYNSKIFSSKNLMYKQPEALRELGSHGIQIDFNNKEDYKKLMALQKEKQLQ